MKYKSEDYEEKRKVHPVLKGILSKDVQLTRIFLSKAKDITIFRSLKVHQKLLEISCHGIVWLVCVVGSIWLIGNEDLYQLQMNLLMALILDIICIAFLKALTRRRRPSPTNDIGPDKFSFPSGHASRAAMLVYIFVYVNPLPIICIPPLLAWLVTVAVSRVVAEKHFLLDIFAGIGIGFFEGLVMSVLWLSRDSSIYLVSWLSDEKLAGADYHV